MTTIKTGEMADRVNHRPRDCGEIKLIDLLNKNQETKSMTWSLDFFGAGNSRIFAKEAILFMLKNDRLQSEMNL